jgi:hypothetical protein
MALPTFDTDALERRGHEFSVVDEGGMTCVLLSDFPLPPGFTVAKSNLLLRLNPGYPDVPPDMWWFEPAVQRTDNVPIAATDCFENFLGRRWQRWSRHLTPEQWRPGVDSIESFVAVINRELASNGAVAA